MYVDHYESMYTNPSGDKCNDKLNIINVFIVILQINKVLGVEFIKNFKTICICRITIIEK